MNHEKGIVLLSSLLLVLTANGVTAKTLNWARAGDSLTMDPHAQNEGPTHALSSQIYEPLIQRDMSGKQVAALATEWGPSKQNPNVWVFKLRQGVKFHDGAEFDSDDVVFSFNRAMSPNSDMKELLSSVKEVRAAGKFGFEIETNGPNPIMAANLNDIYIMDRGWAETNNAVKVQNVKGGEDTFAAKNTNGTGPYKLISRVPDSKTVLEKIVTIGVTGSSRWKSQNQLYAD